MVEKSEMLERAAREVSLRFKKDSPLKPRQKEVLEAIAGGENAFAALPTGYGKSLCYWAPAAAWGWKVWVVSPLVSLILDQSQACRELGLETGCWHGGMGREARLKAEEELRSGRSRIQFLSPERLARWWDSGLVRELLAEGAGPDLIALDEMHCFEDWRAFRNGYKDAFGPVRLLSAKGIPILGLSASLSRAEADVWMAELSGRRHRHVGSALGRDNLKLQVRAVETEGERWLVLASFLKDMAAGDSALVYCATRKECDEVNRWLQSAGFCSSSYHAGLPPAIRSARSQAFRLGLLPVVCATSAFGMGVDFPRVRKVLHFSLPYSLEAYWQEAGRGGRDGKEAVTLALWRRSEITRARHMKAEEKERYLALWEAWASGICRKQAVANRLGLKEAECGKCDRCRSRSQASDSSADTEETEHREVWWQEDQAGLAVWAREKIFSGL